MDGIAESIINGKVVLGLRDYQLYLQEHVVVLKVGTYLP